MEEVMTMLRRMLKAEKRDMDAALQERLSAALANLHEFLAYKRGQL